MGSLFVVIVEHSLCFCNRYFLIYCKPLCGRYLCHERWDIHIIHKINRYTVPCLLQIISRGGAFFSTTLSTRTWYRNSATSFISRWNATLSTTNTIALHKRQCKASSQMANCIVFHLATLDPNRLDVNQETTMENLAADKHHWHSVASTMFDIPQADFGSY